MKLWDIRNNKEPIREWKDLTNLNAKTGVCISPDESIILTGTSVRKGFAFGLLMGFDAVTGDKICATPISRDSVICVEWHPYLN